MKTNLLFKIFTVFLIAISIGFYSCNTSIPQYGNGFASTQVAYMHKPTANNEPVSANYVSGSYSTGGIYDNEDKNRSFDLSYHRSNAFKFYSFSYGVYGFHGRYQVNSQGPLGGNKSYYGFGFRGAACLNYQINNFEWRVLGVLANLNSEYGTYRSFKDNSYHVGPDYSFKLIDDVHPGKWSNTYGLTTEVVANVNDNIQFGMLLALSNCITEKGPLFYPSITLHGNYKAYGASLTISETNYMKMGSTAFRLHYQF